MAADQATPVEAARALPSGTVTFLFTDIEGSTLLVQALGDAFPAVLAAHRELIETAVRDQGGVVFGAEGDGLFAAFADAGSAVRAALAAQRALASHPWPHGVSVRVRMGIHTGEAVLSGGDYVGLTLHQGARVAAAGHGGQVLVSEASRGLVQGSLGEGVDLKDLDLHRLKDLTHPVRLYQLMAVGLDATFPLLRTLDARPNNLPTQMTSFVGRDELDEASRLLGGTRLLTLTGPGGTGKTRLALQLAAEVMDEYPDGVFFVALDAVTEQDLVPSAIVAALGVDAGTRPPLEALTEHLRNKRLLLVLDNFEQVADGAAAVGQLLRDAPLVRIAVTSRILLRIYGEQEFRVPPLRVPDPATATTAEAATAFEAVRLFVERAMASDPTFRLTDEDAPAAVEIVRRLDGLPLAIELAAARVRVLPVQALRDRLDRRLSLLTGGSRDLPARQQTLRGAIDWSYDLLEPPARRLFERFAVFAGGSCLSEAEAVCGPAEEVGGEVLDGLEALVQQSLVRSVPGHGREPRFAMLATIREYATERMAASPDHEEVTRRHSSAYLKLAESVADELTGQRGGELLDRLELDMDNIRVVIERAIAADDADTAARLGAAIWRLWQIRGYLHEAERTVHRIAAIPSLATASSLVRSRFFGAAGSIAYWRADPVMRDRYGISLAEARRSGDQRAIAEALYNSGFGISQDPAFSLDRRFAEGRLQFEEALELYRELGDDRGQAGALWALAIAAMGVDDLAAARTLMTDSLQRNEAIGDPFGIGWCQHILGLLSLREERFDDALTHFVAALHTFLPTRDASAITLLLADFSILAARRDDLERYWRLAGAVETQRITSGSDIVLAPVASWDLHLPSEPVDDPVPLAAWNVGRAWTRDQAVDYALEAATPT